jgi:dGTPase
VTLERSLYQETDYQARLRRDESNWRSAFRRDFARLLHSPAFRRLQGKTQLFAGIESDFFRNRLTHSLEVAQIAKSIALRLNTEGPLTSRGWQIDLDLVEFAGLAHDLGHPPFGHTGEHALDELMRDDGGFEGNAQTLRILARLEKKLDKPGLQLNEGNPVWYSGGKDSSVGLNLSARSYASVLKYDKLIPGAFGGGFQKGYYESESEVVEWIRQAVLPAGQGKLKTLECQVMDIADDIAYSTYDIEDAFKGGLLTVLDLLHPPDGIVTLVADRASAELGRAVSQGDVKDSVRDLLGPIASGEVGAVHGSARLYADSGFFRTKLTSNLVGTFADAVTIAPNAESPALSRIGMDPTVRLKISVLKHLTYTYLINSQQLQLVSHRGREIVRRIFGALLEPDGFKLLPDDHQQRFKQAPTEPHKKRVVCDFIAGMTDRYATEFFARLTSDSFHSMFKPH